MSLPTQSSFQSTQILLNEFEEYKQCFNSLPIPTPPTPICRKRKHHERETISYDHYAMQPRQRRKLSLIPMNHTINYKAIQSEHKSDCCFYLERNIRFEQMESFNQYQSDQQELNKNLQNKSSYPFKLMNYKKADGKQIIHIKSVQNTSAKGSAKERFGIHDRILIFCSCSLESLGGTIIDINIMNHEYVIRLTKYSTALSEYQHLAYYDAIHSSSLIQNLCIPIEIIAILIGLLDVHKTRKIPYHDQKQCQWKLYKDKHLFHTFRSQLQGIETFFRDTAVHMSDHWFWRYYFRPNLMKQLSPQRMHQYQQEMTRVAKIYPYLNPSQLRAIVLAMYEELVIIQGPPGTGKTHTAIHMIRCILQNHTSPSHYRIVIAAQTNAACNQLLYEIVHQDETLAAKTVRFANPSQIQQNELKPYSYRKRMEHHPQHQHMKQLYKDASGSINKYERENIKERARDLEQSIIRDVLMEANVIISTCYGSCQSVLSSIDVDMILMDESTQISEPEALCVLNLFGHQSKGSKKKLVMIGDPKQLSPVVSSDVAKRFGYDITLFERILTQTSLTQLMECVDAHAVITENARNMNWDGLHHFVMLDIQYRGFDILHQFCNEQFYQNKIKHFQKWNGKGLIAGVKWENGKPLTMIAVNGRQRSYKKSWTNEKEAKCVMDVISGIIDSEIESNDAKDMKVLQRFNQIGIITPFTEQRDLIKRNLRILQNKYQQEVTDIQVATVDAFQGQQKDLIIYSMVKTDGEDTLFGKNAKRVNVALTRAKSGFVFIGNIHQLSSSYTLFRLRDYFDGHGVIRCGY